MKSILKVVGGIIFLIFFFSIFKFISPLLLLGGSVALWYFNRESTEGHAILISKIVIGVGIVGILLSMFTGKGPKDVPNDIEPTIVQVEENKDFELKDDIAVFTKKIKIDSNGPKEASKFSQEMADLLEKDHSIIEKGAIFKLTETKLDDYGNEVGTNVLVVYYNKDTIKNINFKNFPVNPSTGLYDIADAIFAKDNYQTDAIKEKLSKLDNKKAPELFQQYTQ